MTAGDRGRIVEEAGRLLVDGYLPHNTPDMQRASVAIYRLLARGAPVDREALAAALDLSPAAAGALVARFPGSVRRLDRAGRLVAFIGLDLEPTDHRFEVGGRRLHVWCALDGLFLPELLGATARLITRCPATGAEIRVEIAPDGTASARPAAPAMSLVAPDGAACRRDLRGVFCRHVRLLRDAAAGAAWTAGRPDAAWVTLDAALDLARRRNAARFPDVEI